MTDNEVMMTVDAVTRNLSKLPVAECASIHVDANTGRVKDGHLKASAFIIMVKCNGEWRPENEWLHRAGMKTARRVYTSIEKAKAVKKEIIEKWGKATSKSGKKTEAAKAEAAKKATEEVLAKMRAALKAMGLSDTNIDLIIAQANH